MRYLLDTNTVSHLMRGDPRALARLASHGTDRVCVCAITEAEIQFGLAKRPDATRLRHAAESIASACGSNAGMVASSWPNTGTTL